LFIPAALAYSSCLDLLQLPLFIPADFVNTSRICLVKMPWFTPAAFDYSSCFGYPSGLGTFNCLAKFPK
jgi:hypothetical protein